RKEYLSYDQRQRFDSPPILNNVQRAIFVQLPDWAEHYYKTLSTPTNQVGFLLALSEYESDLEQTLEKHLRQEDKVLLDELLSKPETFQRYELTFLKRIPQSMRPSVIKYRVSLF